MALHEHLAGADVAARGTADVAAGARMRPAAAPGRRRAYAEAQRHSSRVRLFRRVIPISAGAAALVLAALMLNPFGAEAGLSLGAIGVSGTQVTMQNPRMTGHRGDNRPYEVTAATAVQDVRKPNVVELRALKARFAVDANGGQARLTAATGVFDSGRERLELRGDVQVETDNGQRADLRSASIDFKANTVTSREPVKVTLSGGQVEADNLEVTEGGKVIVFTGRVRGVFDAPPAADPAPAEEPRAEPPAAAIPAPPQVASPQAASSSPAQRAPTRTTQAETASRQR